MPNQGAEEFRAVKRAREEGGSTGTGRGAAQGEEGSSKRRRGVAFGTGALEETDTFGDMEDYVTAEDGSRRNEEFAYEVASDDEDVPAGCAAARFLSPGALLQPPSCSCAEENRATLARMLDGDAAGISPGFLT